VRRRLFTILSVFSLLLCFATLALWIRSRGTADFAGFQGEGRGFWLDSGRGSLFVGTAAITFPHALDSGTGFFHSREKISLVLWQPAQGIGSFRAFSDSDANHFWITFPHWFLAIVFAVLPAYWLGSFVRSRRARCEGLCTKCGYDLRASPDRCPECGTVLAKPETISN